MRPVDMMLEEFSIFVAHPTKRTATSAINSLVGLNNTRTKCDAVFFNCMECPLFFKGTIYRNSIWRHIPNTKKHLLFGR